MAKLRLFVAIEIGDIIKKRFRECQERLKAAGGGIKWVDVGNIHITLKFLGEIPVEKVEQVKRQLQSLQPVAPVAINIAGAGFFPNDRAPRVIWLGIEAPPELGQLAARVEQSLESLGIPKENRPFAPHLTLGRFRAVDGLAPLLGILRQQEPVQMGSFTAAEFSLYESQIASGGSIYKKIARFPFTPETPRAG